MPVLEEFATAGVMPERLTIKAKVAAASGAFMEILRNLSNDVASGKPDGGAFPTPGSKTGSTARQTFDGRRDRHTTLISPSDKIDHYC
ncbi:MAG: hypothetical protein IPK63_20380 [Candidatus Competibacteraceae bacterium]|nr:hypothetical protein [Candidatus Competibacteraceae bacterium]